MKKPSYKAIALSVFLATQCNFPATCFLVANPKQYAVPQLQHEQLYAISKPTYYYPKIASSRSFLTVSTADEEAQHELEESDKKTYKQGEGGIWHLSSKEEHA